ncbi:hypothetical protein [Halobacillus sp. B29]
MRWFESSWPSHLIPSLIDGIFYFLYISFMFVVYKQHKQGYGQINWFAGY